MYKKHLLTFVILSGCSWIPSVGPDYEQPPLPTVEKWEVSDENAKLFQEGSLKALPWWEQFKDPVLTDLIKNAREANPTLQAAYARLKQARAISRQGIGSFLPSIDAGYSESRSDFSSNTQNGDFLKGPVNEYGAGLDSSWEIDIFGGGRRGLESLYAQEESAGAQYDSAGITLVAEVAKNYVDYRGLEKRLQIAKRNVEIQTDSQKLVKAKFDAGMSSELDYAQSTAQLESTRATIPVLESQLKAKQYRLAVLSGKVPQQFTIAESPQGDLLDFKEAVLVGQPAELLRARPDVRSAERLLASQTAEIGVAISDIFPKITLVGSFGVRSNQSDNLFDATSKYWSFGPNVKMPIFHGGEIIANIRVQRAKAEEALKLYENTVLSALEDGQNALNAYGSELTRVESLERSFEASKRSLELSQDLYKEGLIDFLRVLDSERAVFSSEDALIQSKQTVASSAIGVYKAFAGSLPVQNPS